MSKFPIADARFAERMARARNVYEREDAVCWHLAEMGASSPGNPHHGCPMPDIEPQADNIVQFARSRSRTGEG